MFSHPCVLPSASWPVVWIESKIYRSAAQRATTKPTGPTNFCGAQVLIMYLIAQAR